MRLKNIIQDHIENDTISIEVPAKNWDLKIYKNPMPYHNKDNNNGKAKYYKNVQHTYSNVVASCDSVIIVVTIKGPSAECGVTMRHGKITVQGIPSQSRTQPTFPISNPNKYNLLDHLKKTLAHISILELLRLSPAHREILEKALSGSYVPEDIDIDQFQAMVGHITNHILTFSEQDLPS